MRIRFSKKVIPHVGVVIVIGAGLFLSRDWPYETALFPRVGCTTVLIVAIISLIGEILRGGGPGEPSDVWVSSHLSEDHSLRRAALIFAWLVLFLIGVWALGYEFAAVAFVFLFMKTTGRQSWGISILFTALSFVFLFSVFRLLLDVVWPHGALWDALGL
jgi:hypothetical protein